MKIETALKRVKASRTEYKNRKVNVYWDDLPCCAFNMGDNIQNALDRFHETPRKAVEFLTINATATNEAKMIALTTRWLRHHRSIPRILRNYGWKFLCRTQSNHGKYFCNVYLLNKPMIKRYQKVIRAFP